MEISLKVHLDEHLRYSSEIWSRVFKEIDDNHDFYNFKTHLFVLTGLESGFREKKINLEKHCHF